jgi:exosortase A-associated hydrolase 2
MLAEAQPALRPVFLDGPSGRLFAIHRAAAAMEGRRRAALFVPPFAEEMNRSRRMAALQARDFAVAGIDTLLLDLFGTGDSEGDFRDANLSRWLDDIMAASDWLAAQGCTSIILWGLRLGALLAVAASTRHPERFKRLLLWQPVIDGRTLLTQFLRIRVAASMADGKSEKTDELRTRLAAGEPVEVAGYEISPVLARELDGMRLGGLTLPAGAEIDWLEVGAEAGPGLLPTSQRVVESWRAAGIAVASATIAGDPFWTLQETTIAPGLIAATTGALMR